jgi:nudix-type nucleoside diphosphatase (YffH/AdpP family)
MTELKSKSGFAVVAEEVVYRGWLTLRRISVSRPDGSRTTNEVENHGSAASVLAYDPERRTVLLVRQFRVPPFLADGRTEMLEAIAGIVEDDSPDDTARREALEEAGLKLGPLEKIAIVWSTPGMSTERLHLYLAPYRREDRVGEGGGVDGEGERITVDEMPATELAASVRAGAVDDMKTLTLAQALMLRHPELFRSDNQK